MPTDPSRAFIKERLARGDSAKAVREAHNALSKLTPSQIESRWGRRWKGLSGAPVTTPKEVHRVQSSLSRKERRTRKEVRAEFRIRGEAQADQARILGIPESGFDPQKAHDAGVMYRATEDERYREEFEEGS